MAMRSATRIGGSLDGGRGTCRRVVELLLAIRNALIQIAHRLILVKRALLVAARLGMGFMSMGFGAHEVSLR